MKSCLYYLLYLRFNYDFCMVRKVNKTLTKYLYYGKNQLHSIYKCFSSLSLCSKLKSEYWFVVINCLVNVIVRLFVVEVFTSWATVRIAVAACQVRPRVNHSCWLPSLFSRREQESLGDRLRILRHLAQQLQ